MEFVINIPDKLLNDIKRIDKNDGVKELLESRHQLSSAYRSIVLIAISEYERAKTVADIKNDRDLLNRIDDLSTEEVSEYCRQNKREIFVCAGKVSVVSEQQKTD